MKNVAAPANVDLRTEAQLREFFLVTGESMSRWGQRVFDTHFIGDSNYSSHLDRPAYAFVSQPTLVTPKYPLNILASPKYLPEPEMIMQTNLQSYLILGMNEIVGALVYPFLLCPINDAHPCKFIISFDLAFETWGCSPDFEALILKAHPKDYFSPEDYDANMGAWEEYRLQTVPERNVCLPVAMTQAEKWVSGALVFDGCNSDGTRHGSLYFPDATAEISKGTKLMRNISRIKHGAVNAPLPIYREVATIREVNYS